MDEEEERQLLVDANRKRRRRLTSVQTKAVVVLMIAVLLNYSFFNNGKPQQHTAKSLFKPLLECPSSFSDGNDEEDHLQYERDSKDIIEKNLTLYLENFRDNKYDQWGQSYNRIKDALLPWKQRVFGHLESGSSIYESACGTGLNLFMTLEVLETTLNITDIVVYGNEYVRSSVHVAQAMAQRLPGNGRLGSICPGDSAKLDFVPANTFDLAYTGYVTPLSDPLKTGKPDDKVTKYYLSEICKDAIKSRRAQRLQEDWYAAWASELIRIAKPGAWIVLERVSRPLCEADFDWGGVDEAFWYRAIRYHEQFTNIDQETIDFEPDPLSWLRYHVRFQKLSD